ncbi:MAG: S9 family peptidase [Firmicutes bacterium]|nr:S9 family peptidase [Bacillota bacterium]
MNKVTIEDVTKIKNAGNLQISPNGKYAVYTVNEPDIKKNGYNYDLWLLNCKTGTSRQLTFLGKDRSAVWDDDHTLLLATGRTEEDRPEKLQQKTTFYRLPVKGSEASKAFEVKAVVLQAIKVQKGIYAMTVLKDRNRLDPEAVDPQLCEEEADYHVIDELPLWGNNRGFVSGKRTALCLFYEKTGRLKTLTDPYFDTRSVSVKDGKIAYTGSRWKDVITRYSELRLYDTTTGETVKIVKPGRKKVGPMAIADGSIVYAASDMKTWGSGQLCDLYRYDFETKRSKKVWTNKQGIALGGGIGPETLMLQGKSVVFKDGSVYMKGLHHAHGEVYCLSSDNKFRKVLEMPTGGVAGFDVTAGRIFFTGCTDETGSDLFCATIGDAGSLKKLTDINGELFKDKYFARPEYIPFTDSDGVQIDGWVLKPMDFDPNKKYPGLLLIHGGPRSAYGTCFSHQSQMMAGAGYFVFFCNPRGGESYGEAFADLRGRYGTIDFDDIMEFTDHVLKLYPQIDPNRLGETGGSYGGFMSNWLVGHTDRFAAIVSQCSIANWINDFADSEIGVTFDANEMGADPWTDVQKLWQQSPFKYADKAKTPILFIHGLEDYNCTVNQGVEMFAAMKHFGVPSRMVLFEGETHNLIRIGRPKHKVRMFKEMMDWFDRYLK